MKNNQDDSQNPVGDNQADKNPQNRSKAPRKSTTRAESNRANGKRSNGPKSDEGKARASANSLKHGFFANVEKLHPHDSRTYIQLVSDLRQGLHPDGPAEEHLIQELAMLSARLQRLEAAEYVFILGNVDGEPDTPTAPDGFIDWEHLGESVLHPDGKVSATPDARTIAAAYERSLDSIERLQRIELHLRRAYNRTWDRLERMQKERHKLPLDEALKRTQIFATYEALKTKQPDKVPPRHPELNDKGKFPVHDKSDPMYRPKNDDDYPSDPKPRRPKHNSE